MLVMISKVEAGQQRDETAELVRPCIVLVSERLGSVTVREEGPEIE